MTEQIGTTADGDTGKQDFIETFGNYPKAPCKVVGM
tara:strand:- start:193 stop:300 length:108 start_codon:yes stop_codon:yes gene_type:complete